MAIMSADRLRNLGAGLAHSEAILVDREGLAYGCTPAGFLYRVAPDGGVERVADLPEGSIPNGFAMDRQGSIFYCCVGKRGVMRIGRDGEVSMFCDRAGTTAINTPNFCSFDAVGNLYVSISSVAAQDLAGLQRDLMTPHPTGALVRIRPDGAAELVGEGFFFANGTAIDPGEEAIYVLQSATRDCVRLPIRKDGTVGKAEIFARDFPSIPDGMAFDAEGRLYVTGVGYKATPDYRGPMGDFGLMPANQILRVERDGRWEILIEDPESRSLVAPTNCAFGGAGMRTLHIANLHGDHFSTVELDTPGHPLLHQR
jgi:sugar lactone lactonase YvrE